MKRLAEQNLIDWYQRKDRKPLIIRGARQVGKSTLVRLFCQNKKLDLIEINLEKIKLSSVKNENIDIASILDEIQLRARKTIGVNSVIFLDEIQESPKLISILRYFYEEKPDLPIIAAGSLLEIALGKETYSFPVGRVEFLHLGPMSFSEYLLATDNDFLVQKLSQLDFSAPVVAVAKESFRNYLYVGGMPEAVKTFVQEKSLINVMHIQSQIIQTYVADFPKYNSRIDVDRIDRIFSSTILHLGKKIIYTHLDNESQSREIKRIVELLVKAKVFRTCIHSDANLTPLLGECDPTIFKLYFLDVGLVNSFFKLDPAMIDAEMKNNFSTKGVIAEQFVAQHLASFEGISDPENLFYWLKDKGNKKGEVDFVVSCRQQIFPIEVKSSSSGHLKSLYYFAKQKKNHVTAIKLSMDNFSIQETQHLIDGKYENVKLVTVPIFAVEYLEKIIESL